MVERKVVVGVVVWVWAVWTWGAASADTATNRDAHISLAVQGSAHALDSHTHDDRGEEDNIRFAQFHPSVNKENQHHDYRIQNAQSYPVMHKRRQDDEGPNQNSQFYPYMNKESQDEEDQTPHAQSYPHVTQQRQHLPGSVPLSSVSVSELGWVMVESGRDAASLDFMTLEYYEDEEASGQREAEVEGVQCGFYTVALGVCFTITSPGFPATYPHKFKCRWKFVAEGGGELSLFCDRFQLGKGDFLSVRTSSGDSVRYRGRQAPHIEKTEGGELEVRFRTNSAMAGPGFSCTTCNGNMPTATTTTSPPTTTDLPLSYPNCGITHERIVNGVETKPHRFPWTVWIFMKWNDGHNRVCGGSIISPSWILTAAHCPFRRGPLPGSVMPPSEVTVTVGAHSITAQGAQGGYKVQVTRVLIHPAMALTHDVSLMQLRTPLTLSEEVWPVCLAPSSWASDDLLNTTVTGVGWGMTETGNLSEVLLEYHTMGYSLDQCREVYGNWLQPTQMCTDGTANGHTCRGDSGGPIMVLGVTSDEGEGPQAEGTPGKRGGREGGLGTNGVGGAVHGSGDMHVSEDLHKLEEVVPRSGEGGVGRAVQVGVVSFGSSSGCNTGDPDGHARVAALVDWIMEVAGLKFDA